MRDVFAQELATFILIVVIVGLLIGLAIGSITFYKKEYVSKTKIVPEIRLTTDGKKVDTLYVYKLK